MFPINSTVPTNSTLDYLVVDNFSSSATDGTYQVTIEPGGISGTSSSGTVNVTGLPITSGAVIAIARYTPTPTGTPTGDDAHTQSICNIEIYIHLYSSA